MNENEKNRLGTLHARSDSYDCDIVDDGKHIDGVYGAVSGKCMIWERK